MCPGVISRKRLGAEASADWSSIRSQGWPGELGKKTFEIACREISAPGPGTCGVSYAGSVLRVSSVANIQLRAGLDCNAKNPPRLGIAISTSGNWRSSCGWNVTLEFGLARWEFSGARRQCVRKVGMFTFRLAQQRSSQENRSRKQSGAKKKEKESAKGGQRKQSN